MRVHAAPTPPARPVAVTRVDPRSNRATARIPLRLADGEPLVPVGVTASDDGVWAWGQAGALRIDPAANRVTRALTVPGDNIKGFYAGDGVAWAATESGRLVRFDARTGERVGALPGPVLSRTFPLVVVPGLIVVGDQAGTLLGVDARTGKERWRIRSAGEIRSWASADGRLWILTPSDTGAGYQLVALNPDTGRATARVALPSTGARGLVAAGGSLWVTLQNGQLAVVG
jgi:outer membrane protein assembly factor BamB